MEDISEEHKAAIKKFLDDKGSILKCGELCISDLQKQKVCLKVLSGSDTSQIVT